MSDYFIFWDTIRMEPEILCEDGEFYFITTKEPNNFAIDSMLDRTFGKSTNNVDITSGGKELPIFKSERAKIITDG